MIEAPPRAACEHREHRRGDRLRLIPRDRRTLLFALLRVGAILLVLFIAGWLFVRSTTTGPGDSFRGSPRAVEGSLTERLRASIDMLAGEIGARSLSERPGLDRAESWIRGEWESQGFKVLAHPYDVQGKTVRNLEVILPGSDAALPAIVIGAHYDSWAATPGADDNASGVAVLLELSRALIAEPPVRTIRFVAFVNEEPPYFMTGAMGSLVYAQALAEEGVELLGMVALETLGYYDETPKSQDFPPGLAAFYPDRGNFLAFVGMLSSSSWIDRWVGGFREVAEVPSESLAAPSFVQGVNWSDHWSFETHGYPALMITDTAPYRNPNYHTMADTPDTIDFETLARVTEGLIATLRVIQAAR